MTSTDAALRLPKSVRRPEAELLPVLLRWLAARRWIRDDTTLVGEFPWLGRRIDLATMTSSDSIVAYELKLRDTRRAIEQAAANRLTFDRSYVVSATPPGIALIELAAQSGVGLLVESGTQMKLVLSSPSLRCDPVVRRRLRDKIALLNERGYRCSIPFLTT